MKTKNKFAFFCIPIISFITIWLLSLQVEIESVDLIKTCIFSFLLIMIVELYLYFQESKLYKLVRIKNKQDKLSYPVLWYIVLLYIVSCAGLLLVEKDLLFWCIGGLLGAMLVDMQFGLLMHFSLTYLAVVFFYKDIDKILYFVVLGVVISILSGFLKKKSTAIYSFLIILSIYISMNFIMNNFAFKETVNLRFLGSFSSLFAVLIIAYIVYRLISRKLYIIEDEYQENSIEVQAKTNELPFESAEAVNVLSTSEKLSEIEDNNTIELSNRLQEILSEEFELKKKLQEYSISLFAHSKLIADVSEQAAKSVDANVLLAKAGGFYHEIGRMKGTNYIEEGISLSLEYNLPEQIQDIIRQHNIKNQKPTSMEAIIVMFSDNIISSLDYIKKSSDEKTKKLTPEKIINQIFQNRMEKGTLEEAGMTLNSYKKLLNFYLGYFNNYNEEAVKQ